MWDDLISLNTHHCEDIVLKDKGSSERVESQDRNGSTHVADMMLACGHSDRPHRDDISRSDSWRCCALSVCM